MKNPKLITYAKTTTFINKCLLLSMPDLKLFTEPSGLFQMYMPVEWQYKNPSFNYDETQPHAFGEYGPMLGAFQISCKPVTLHIQEIITNNRLAIQKGGAAKLSFVERHVRSGGTDSYIWMAAVEDHFFLATFIVDTGDAAKIADKLVLVRESLDTVLFVLPAHRPRVLSFRRYDLFMASTAAMIELRNKALKNGSFIELVVLTANRIDASLRLAIILKNQLEARNDDIDTSLLYQGEEDKIITEKEIYKRALSRGIIDQGIYDQLWQLYGERNKVVHRYIISDIRTEQVIKIAFRYYEIEDKVDTIVNQLEHQQFEGKVGLHALHDPGKLSDTQLEKLKAAVLDKHGNIKWGES